jgi:hypothetical protein
MTDKASFFKTVEHVGPNALLRTKALGLSIDGLLTVVDQGERARAQATKHDPRTAASHDAWRYRVRGLRDTFCPSPFLWVPLEERGLEMISSPCGQRTIITRAGDMYVGQPGTHPQPTSDIGEVTAKRVRSNGSRFLNPDWFNVGTAVVSGTEMWMLLVHRGEDAEEDIAFSELSLPSSIGEDGYVAGWIERIIIPLLDLRGPSEKSVPSEPFAVEDVPVTRKQR